MKTRHTQWVTSQGTLVKPPISKTPFVIALLIIITVISMIMTEFNLLFLMRNFNRLTDIFSRFLNPDFSVLSLTIRPLIQTISMAIFGTVIGTLFAFPIAFIAANNLNKRKYIVIGIRFIVSVFRTLPILIYAFLFTLIYGFTPLSGAIAISIITFVRLMKFFYEKIESVNLDVFHGIEAIGLSRTRSIKYALLPQLKNDFLAKVFYQMDTNLRSSTILGYVGAGGIGSLLNTTMQTRQYERVIVVLLVIFMTLTAFEMISKALRRRYL